MLAARFYGAGDIRIEEIKKPRISKDEILVKVKSAALCGTDLRMYRHGLANNASLPITLGHEFSGVIAEVGAEVSHYTEGMEVVVAPNMGCGVCRQCVQGNTHHCPDYKALGIHLDGGFAEYVRIPKEAVVQGNVMPIPAGLSFEEAALVEPLSSVYSGLERCQVGLGDYVLIIGGPLASCMPSWLCWPARPRCCLTIATKAGGILLSRWTAGSFPCSPMI